MLQFSTDEGVASCWLHRSSSSQVRKADIPRQFAQHLMTSSQRTSQSRVFSGSMKTACGARFFQQNGLKRDHHKHSWVITSYDVQTALVRTFPTRSAARGRRACAGPTTGSGPQEGDKEDNRRVCGDYSTQKRSRDGSIFVEICRHWVWRGLWRGLRCNDNQ